MLVDFLASGPAPINVGFGSEARHDSERLHTMVLDAIRRTCQRAVLAAGWGGLGRGRLSDEVLAIESVPHDWLFPRCKAVVRHAGVGTTAAGLRAGVPAVTVPFFADLPFWGRRVRTLGAGPRPIAQRDLTVERLASAVRLATHDWRIRARAAAVGQRVESENGGASTVRGIESYLAGRDRWGSRTAF